MPSFNDYDQDITKQGNAATTHEEMRNLIDWYGAGLRQLVETGTTDGKKAFAKVTAGKVPKADATALKAKFDAFVGKFEGANVGPNVNPYCGKQAKNLETKAKVDETDAVADVQSGDGDEASELYVDSALQYFRAAMCHFHQGDLKNPKFANGPVQQAAFDYGRLMIKAAQMLNDAARNEDNGDVLEVIAECELAKSLLDKANAMLTALQNSGALQGAANKQKVANEVAKVAPAQTAADAALGPHQK